MSDHTHARLREREFESMLDLRHTTLSTMLALALAGCGGGGGDGGAAGGGAATPTPGAACTVNGESFASGSTFFAFPGAEAVEPDTCELVQYSCQDGIVSDTDGNTVDVTPLANECFVRAARECPTQDFVLQHQETDSIFTETEPEYGTTCAELGIVATCDDGVLTSSDGELVDGLDYFRNCFDPLAPLSAVVAEFEAQGIDVIAENYVVQVDAESIEGILFLAPNSTGLASGDPNRLSGFLVYGVSVPETTEALGDLVTAPTGRFGDLDAAIGYAEAVSGLTQTELETFVTARAAAEYAPVLEERRATTIRRNATAGSESIRVADGQPDRFSFFHPAVGELSADCRLRVDDESAVAVNAPRLFADTNSFSLDTVAEVLALPSSELVELGIEPGATLPLECTVGSEAASGAQDRFDGVVLDVTYECEGLGC